MTIMGSVTDNPADEVIVLYDQDGKAEAVVCAVPYLRDRDVRKSEIYESIDDKARKLVEGIHNHYLDVVEIAQQKQNTLPNTIPVIAMGHLFAAGGQVAENNEVRDLYVGSLAHINAALFPEAIDYLALGHLHIAQKVNSSTTMRYSGSPLQLSFGRNNSQKSITSVNFSSDILVETVAVPRFLRLETLSGNRLQIMTALDHMLHESKQILIEVHYSGQDIAIFRDELDKKVAGSNVELIRVINTQTSGQASQQERDCRPLEDLDETEVFRKCLDAHEIVDEEREELEYCFAKILELLAEESEEEESK